MAPTGMESATFSRLSRQFTTQVFKQTFGHSVLCFCLTKDPIQQAQDFTLP